MAKSAKSKPTKATKKVAKIEPKKQVKKKAKPIVPEPVPEVVLDESGYLTDEQFDGKYKLATTECFKEGELVFLKERFGDKWIAKQVPQIGVIPVDAAAFNDLVLRNEAYIKR